MERFLDEPSTFNWSATANVPPELFITGEKKKKSHLQKRPCHTPLPPIARGTQATEGRIFASQIHYLSANFLLVAVEVIEVWVWGREAEQTAGGCISEVDILISFTVTEGEGIGGEGGMEEEDQRKSWEEQRRNGMGW